MPNTEIPTPDGFFDQFFAPEETPPPSFRTLKDISQAYGVTIDVARTRMERLEAQGLVEKRQFVATSTNGRRIPMWHYGPKTREEPGH